MKLKTKMIKAAKASLEENGWSVHDEVKYRCVSCHRSETSYTNRLNYCSYCGASMKKVPDIKYKDELWLAISEVFEVYEKASREDKIKALTQMNEARMGDLDECD